MDIHAKYQKKLINQFRENIRKKLINQFRENCATDGWTDRLTNRGEFIGSFWHAEDPKRMRNVPYPLQRH